MAFWPKLIGTDGLQRCSFRVALSFSLTLFAVLNFASSCSTHPKHGERVKAPEGLNEQLHEYFAEKEHIAIAEIKFFRCDWIKLGDEVIPDKPGYDVMVKLQNRGDAVPQFKSVFASDRDNINRGTGKWDFSVLTDYSWGTQQPCEWKGP